MCPCFLHFQAPESHAQADRYAEDELYKFHYDSELGAQSVENDIVRYVTMFLYLEEPDVGGETYLPLATGMNRTDGSSAASGACSSLGCGGCQRSSAGLSSGAEVGS